MKRELIIACLAVTMFSSCAHTGRNELPSSSPRATEIRNALNQTVIPLVDLENVKVQDALKFWSNQSKANHRQHFDFRHVISYPTIYSTQPTKQGGRAATASVAAPAMVTVRRKNITSEQLLDEICQQSNYVWTILGRMIVIKPRGSPSPDAQP